jgi:hypothetical protein
VTTERRLAKVEAALGPKELVLRWLAEAHAYDSLEAYIDHTLSAGPETLPLNRLPHELIAAIRGRRDTRSRDIDSEIRASLRALLFRVHLVFRIIDRTAAVVERQELIHAAMTAHMGLTIELNADERRPTFQLPMLRDLVMLQVTEMLALQEARRRAEIQYLAGTPCLFPDGLRRWDAIVHDMQTTAVLADRLVEFDEGQSIEAQRTIPTEERIDACLADLVEMARIKTLDDLGEGSAAFDRTQRWLASKRHVPTAWPMQVAALE